MMKALKYRIVLKKDPDEGVYIVSVPSLPGCHTFGKTVEEAIEMAKKAIEGYIETLIDLGKEVPTEIAKPSYPAFDRKVYHSEASFRGCYILRRFN